MHSKIIYSFLDNLCCILWQEMKEFQFVIMRVSIKEFYQLTWTTPMTCHKYNRYIYFILYNVIYLKGVCSLHFCNKTIIKTLDTKKNLSLIYIMIELQIIALVARRNNLYSLGFQDFVRLMLPYNKRQVFLIKDLRLSDFYKFYVYTRQDHS